MIEISRTINIDWKTLWRIPLYIWYTIGSVMVVGVVGYLGYRKIKWSRVPEITKKIIRTRKVIEKDNQIKVKDIIELVYEAL